MSENDAGTGTAWCINLVRVARHIRPIAVGIAVPDIPAAAVLEFEALKFHRSTRNLPKVSQNDLDAACRAQGIDCWADVGIVGKDPKIGPGDTQTLRRVLYPFQMPLMTSFAGGLDRFLADRAAAWKLRDVCDHAAESIAFLYQKAESIEQAIVNMATEHAGELNGLRRHMCTVHVGHNNAIADIEHLQRDFNRLTTEATGLRAQVCRLTSEATALRAEVSRLTAEVTDLRADANAGLGLALLGEAGFRAYSQVAV